MVKFSVAVGLLLVMICWTSGSTGTTISLSEEKFLKLMENYDEMKEVVKSLESKVNELETKDVQMQGKLTELEAKVKQQDSLISDLLREKIERTKTNTGSSPMGADQSAVAVINGLPSSCGDLTVMGHTLNGFYSVMGSAMLESVYCDFSKIPSDAGFQKWIGYFDVKSVPVHFYVQKESPFKTFLTPITFEIERINVGDAMNLTSGIFTAPRPGIYFFSFAGMAQFPFSTSSLVFVGAGLYLNGDLIGRGRVDETNTISSQWSPFSLHSTLNLKSDDQIWVQIDYMSTGAYLVDRSDHFTHFTGFMLQEEIALSL